MPSNPLQSLSVRLLVIFLLFGALFAYGIMLSIRWVYSEDDLRSLISGHLSLHVEYVRRDIGNPPNLERALAITESVPVDIRIYGPDIDWSSDPDFPPLADLSFAESEFFSEEPDAWIGELEDVEFAVLGTHRFLRLAQEPYAIIVSTKRIDDDRRAPPLLPVVIGMGLLLVFLTYLAVRRLFLPIGEIREGAARIGRGDFDHRIGRVRRDELGELAGDVNKVAADVQGMLDAKRQLLLGISHELRTPLSRLRLALEFLPEDTGREGIATDIDEMERIIGTLLEAERLNDRHAALHKSAVEPLALANSVIADYFSRDSQHIRVIAESELKAVNIDEPRVILLLKNLLSNALRYTDPDGAPITVGVRLGNGKLQISVTDSGPGFPHDQIEHIGEPFWRGDPSRTRGTGGSGLGLYLTRLVATAHGGSLRLDERHVGGARFIVELPV